MLPCSLCEETKRAAEPAQEATRSSSAAGVSTNINALFLNINVFHRRHTCLERGRPLCVCGGVTVHNAVCCGAEGPSCRHLASSLNTSCLRVAAGSKGETERAEDERIEKQNYSEKIESPPQFLLIFSPSSPQRRFFSPDLFYKLEENNK